MPLDRSLHLQSAIPLTDTEPHFGVEELFFSRTDPAGLMLSGNSVFQRVSEYSWNELIGRPHKLIRHPGTPRAVFHILWETIKAGRPVGAYVRNKAKTGGHYWVFAVVTPIPGGYLSVRLKPTSSLLPGVQALYDAHVERERSTGCTPAESAATLRGRVAEMGFRSYDAFAAAALAEELATRAATLGRAPDPVASTLRSVSELAAAVLTRAAAVQDSYLDVRHAPMNFSLEASRAGAAGASTGVVARNYQALAQELNGALADFVDAARRLNERVTHSLFLACTAALQREMRDLFEAEGGDGASSRDDDRLVLDAQQAAYSAEARASLNAVLGAVEAFGRSCIAMGRLASGLEVTRVMGKVEWAKVGVVSTHMDALLDDFGAFQKGVRDGLREMEGFRRRIGEHAHEAAHQAS